MYCRKHPFSEENLKEEDVVLESADQEVYTMSITCEEASEFAGENIKAAGADAASLERLLEKAGLVGVRCAKPVDM